MRVIDENGDVRLVRCHCCGNTLEYEREDVKFESENDGSGPFDESFSYIKCMVCQATIWVAESQIENSTKDCGVSSTMDAYLHKLHLDAGRICGSDATCGAKHAYDSEEMANRAAAAHNRWDKRRHDVEPYPCYYCKKWHTGGIMSIEALKAIVASEG